MTRRVYHSFHYERDVDRVSQVRQIGALAGQRLVSPNEWESVKRRGSFAVKRWIRGQLQGKSCVIVLIGAETSRRRWVSYEIERGWEEGRAMLGVHIHNLKNLRGQVSRKGPNPFRKFTVSAVNRNMASIVPTYDPPFQQSRRVYREIADNLEGWVEEAIAIRRRYPS